MRWNGWERIWNFSIQVAHYYSFHPHTHTHTYKDTHCIRKNEIVIVVVAISFFSLHLVKSISCFSLIFSSDLLFLHALSLRIHRANMSVLFANINFSATGFFWIEFQLFNCNRIDARKMELLFRFIYFAPIYIYMLCACTIVLKYIRVFDTCRSSHWQHSQCLLHFLCLSSRLSRWFFCCYCCLAGKLWSRFFIASAREHLDRNLSIVFRPFSTYTKKKYYSISYRGTYWDVQTHTLLWMGKSGSLNAEKIHINI